jgi:3-dehydroquinate synthase
MTNMHYTLTFNTAAVKYQLHSSFGALDSLIDPANSIIITDTDVAGLYPHLFTGHRTVIIPAGERNKTLETVQYITEQLLQHQAHRKTFLVGIGGGTVTDITGFVASIYMRGLPFGFVPTTLLGMVDAAIGGKNGVNMGLHKNLLGTITQPQFILYFPSFLETLPIEEWSNGFAEVIKYACIFDKELFEELSDNNINYYQQNREALTTLISRCVDWKNKTVLEDEKESDKRKLLNFGHTAGHALETQYHIPHGHAVALGMIIACMVSEQVEGLDISVRKKLVALLQQYKLPTIISFDIEQVMNLLKMDKKRTTDAIDYIVLEGIGKAVIKNIQFDTIEKALVSFKDAGNY